MNKYPTDEELELFISQIEEGELYAPRHMKEQILSQAFPKQAVRGRACSGSGGRGVQLLAYRVKIIAGMAAALLVLMILPMQERNPEGWDVGRKERSGIWEQELEREDTVDINHILNESTRRMNQKMNAWFGRMGDLERFNLFDRKEGGHFNEN